MAIVDRLPDGMRDSIPVAVATIPLGITFGVTAVPVIGAWAAVVMSAVVWAGGAQFAALGVLTGGGSLAVATGAGAVTNGRFIPMGFAIAPSLTARWPSRLLTGMTLVDASFVIARRDGGERFDPIALRWAAPLQWIGWLGGTVVGVLGAGVLDDPEVLGLDAIIPVFFLGLLLPDLFDSPRAVSAIKALRHMRIHATPVVAAVLAAAVTLLLTPFTPPGVPILAGALTAVIGLRKPTTVDSVDESASVA